METYDVGPNAFFSLWYGSKSWGPENRMWKFERKHPSGSDTRRGVALLEKVCHCGGGLFFKVFFLQTSLCVTVSQLPDACKQGVGFSISPPLCLSVCCLVPSHVDNRLNLWICKWATPIICFLYKCYCCHGIFSEQ